MINQYFIDQPKLLLESDVAGEFPLYIYWSKSNQILLYSTSIVALLNDSRVLKPLKLSIEGLSFLLQNGVVPPPKTAYQDIYILGIGDKAEVSTKGQQINVHFSHQFPFLNANRLIADETPPDEELILELLAEATISRIDSSKPVYLFHSAGKDSNSIALALAEAGWQSKVTLITQKSKGMADESEISRKIAKRLGFKHRILHEVDELKAEHKGLIEEFFSKSPFPSTDNVTLAYPLYLQQVPELREANIIDGGGNDSHMMLPPSPHDIRNFRIAKFSKYASSMRRYVNSESYLSFALRTPAEWCGMSGLSLADTLRIFPEALNVYSYWKNESKKQRMSDLVDYKTSILTPIVASEMHIRKARNFADAVGSNLILPFANKAVAEYFSKMPEKYLFDRKSNKNKLVLRKMLKDRIGLDSDALGKKGWTYDHISLVAKNFEYFASVASRPKLWNGKGLNDFIERIRRYGGKSDRASRVGYSVFYRVVLISYFCNYSSAKIQFPDSKLQ